MKPSSPTLLILILTTFVLVCRSANWNQHQNYNNNQNQYQNYNEGEGGGYLDIRTTSVPPLYQNQNPTSPTNPTNPTDPPIPSDIHHHDQDYGRFGAGEDHTGNTGIHGGPGSNGNGTGGGDGTGTEQKFSSPPEQNQCPDGMKYSDTIKTCVKSWN